MNPLVVLVLILAAITFFCCVALIFHKEYDDGFVGRIGLSLMAMVAASRAFYIFEHYRETAHDFVTPYSILLWIGLALFLLRHTWRFMRRARVRPESWYATEDKGKHGAFKLVEGGR